MSEGAALFRPTHFRFGFCGSFSAVNQTNNRLGQIGLIDDLNVMQSEQSNSIAAIFVNN